MKSISSSLFTAAFLATAANAHTYVWSVWINGVDQGTGVGIREPAYNGPPLSGTNPFGQGSGYANSPVRDLNSVDMRCNVMGDIPDPTTLKVKPGDIVTFEWHHESRSTSDDIIDGSHKGAGLVYISPNPPTANSWVKIQEEGENPKGTWYVTGKHTQRKGKQDVQIPAGLKPGQYLLRPELVTLHEAEVSHLANANRGVQLYMECIQIEVTGSGTVSLPAGVSFPGAYSYSDPGIVYNLYYQPAGSPLYVIPGPPVWSGAAPSPAAPAYGSPVGEQTATRWNTWISSSTVYVVNNGVTTTSKYTATWPTTYVTPSAPASSTKPTSAAVSTSSTPASTPVSTPVSSSTRTSSSAQPSNTSVAQLYGQCGGIGWTGPTTCASPATCKKLNDYYYQCLN